jgi:cob(I)alamin adenosyltransferase
VVVAFAAQADGLVLGGKALSSAVKLYTRTGDDGTTGLFSGARVSKDHPRIEAYGTVDETNSALGLAAAGCADDHPFEVRLREILVRIQSRLFDIGADLATPEGAANESRISRTDDSHVLEAEAWIDEMESGNTPLRQFVLPGGSELAARLHLARTVSRRAERLMITLSHTEPVTPAAIRFINRLSDLMFAAARRANAERGVKDVTWGENRSG